MPMTRAKTTSDETEDDQAFEFADVFDHEAWAAGSANAGSKEGESPVFNGNSRRIRIPWAVPRAPADLRRFRQNPACPVAGMRVPWVLMNFRWINALLWGNSVALAWMWGLGLFFSVQMTFMFGLQGLLLFAIPNALGLMLFGFLTQIVAKRHAGGQESLALFFDKFAKPFRLIFYLYQVVALALTVFALTQIPVWFAGAGVRPR